MNERSQGNETSHQCKFYDHQKSKTALTHQKQWTARTINEESRGLPLSIALTINER